MKNIKKDIRRHNTKCGNVFCFSWTYRAYPNEIVVIFQYVDCKDKAYIPVIPSIKNLSLSCFSFRRIINSNRLGSGWKYIQKAAWVLCMYFCLKILTIPFSAGKEKAYSGPESSFCICNMIVEWASIPFSDKYRGL